jgi:diguanylate cyclase (GGDEF)-like protein
VAHVAASSTEANAPPDLAEILCNFLVVLKADQTQSTRGERRFITKRDIAGSIMHLDLPTLAAMSSFVAVCVGVILLVAASQTRTTAGVAVWGIANIVAGIGIFCLMLGSAIGWPSASIFGGMFMALSQGLVWKAARTLDAHPASLLLALLGGLTVLVGNMIPALETGMGSLGLAAGATYLLAAAISLWRGREERLPARWPLIFLLAAHASVLVLGLYSTLSGTRGQHEVPPLLSVFGLVHFEGIIFFVGCAVFILALVKEREEAASRAAANTDPLTGIANRVAFMERAERIVERCKRDGTPVCVMMFDLDHFKTINDTHGHAVGDDVIRKFCEATAAMLRPTDAFGRMGGEEFAVVLPGSDIEAAGVRADWIRTSFASSCRFMGNRQVNATASAGVAAGAEPDEYILNTLVEQADQALYGAKADGRNRTVRADHSAPRNSSVIRVA